MKRILIAVTAILSTLSLMAEGYQVNTLSARQLGMGHTGVAQKLGAESMFFNPGALGFSQKTLDLAGSATIIKASATATVDNASYSTDNDVSTPLSLNASFRILDNLQAGVSFYTPYGSGINWGLNWPGAILSQKVNLATYTVQPTISWRILPNLSVGAGLMVTWGNVDLTKGLVGKADIPGMPLENTPATISLSGKARVAFGLNVGVLYDINKQWSLGAAFRSRMTMTVRRGEASVAYNAPAAVEALLRASLNDIHEANFTASMPCPYVFSFGVSYKPLNALTLALDAQLTGWKTYRSLNITFPEIGGENPQRFDQHITKNYRNSWLVKIGAQYNVTPRFDVRAGLMVDTSPVNALHYNPETPGMTKIEPTVGFSFRPVDRLSIDFAFMYVAGMGKDNASCTYTNIVTGATQTFTASYKANAYIPSLGLSYSF